MFAQPIGLVWAPGLRVVDRSFVALDDGDVVVDYVNPKQHSFNAIGD